MNEQGQQPKQVFVIKSYGNHMVLLFYNGAGFTWAARSEWDRPYFFRYKPFAERIAKQTGGEVVEWRGQCP